MVSAVTPERAVVPTPAPTEIADILQLQQSIGNRAVARMLADRPARLTVMRAPPSHAGDSSRPSVAPPQVRGWDVKVTPGNLGGGLPRAAGADGRRVFLGDTVTVRARFQAGHAAGPIAFGRTITGTGECVEINERGWGGDRIFEWEVIPKKVGTERVSFSLLADDGDAFAEYETDFHVVTDLIDFIQACQEAQGMLFHKFTLATVAINDAATAFRQAYGEQEDVLDKLAASQKMLADMAFGVLFAAAGGYVGSSVGAMLKDWKVSVNIRGEVSSKSILSDAIIDSAKDTAKFTVRATDRLRGTGPSGLGHGDSMDPPVTNPIRQGKDDKPSGENPQDFLTTLSSRVAKEGAVAQSQLTDLISKGRRARKANSKVDFDEDPVEVVAKGQTLDKLASDLVTEKRFYVASLWKAWLKDHGWQTAPVMHAIQQAAKDVGEDADTWIQKRQGGNPPPEPSGRRPRPL